MGMHKEFKIEYCTMLLHSQTLCPACSVQLDMAVCQSRAEWRAAPGPHCSGWNHNGKMATISSGGESE